MSRGRLAVLAIVILAVLGIVVLAVEIFACVWSLMDLFGSRSHENWDIALLIVLGVPLLGSIFRNITR